MSTTYTANVKLGQPALGDTGWSTPLNANCSTLDALNPVGDLAVTTAEVPSASLNVAVANGVVLAQDGTTVTYAGAATQAITASTTKVLYLDGTASWALTVAASLPSTPHVKLATVVAGASTITSVTDNRQCFNVAGTIADGVNLTFGTLTGTKIGTATTQKLGFFNATPIVQPTSTTDLRTALINLGFVATGGASPLNLNGGVLTVGSETIADGGNIAVGTSTGTQIATATSQKLGFFGKTPAVQPTMGAVTAGSSYTSVEQGIINALVTLVRTLGLGS